MHTYRPFPAFPCRQIKSRSFSYRSGCIRSVCINLATNIFDDYKMLRAISENSLVQCSQRGEYLKFPDCLGSTLSLRF